MTCFRETINENASLTACLLDASPEMPERGIKPAVLVFPGGGYHGCSDREAEPVAMAFAARGYHTFILRYTVGVGHRFEEPLADAVAALRRIREQADAWGVAADKIAVCGFSAGGHLAAAVSVMDEERPNASILGYPCILDSMNPILAFPVPSCTDFVDGKTPPAFLFHTADDSVVPVENALRYAGALDQAGVPFELHVFPHGPHGLSLANAVTCSGNDAMVSPAVAEWIPLCARWLEALFA